jgi:uncharacterized protein
VPRFEWNPDKARRNLRKHGISFEEAVTAFSDDEALLLGDPDHSTDEERFILLGLSGTLRLLTVVHCYRDVDDVIHLISARRATRSERVQYGARWMR